MSLQDLGSLGELISAVAVVVSLLYLAVQIRQNTRSVRSSTFQSAVRDTTEIIDPMIHYPELNRIWYDGVHDFDSLSTEDRRRFAAYMTSTLRRLENLVYQTNEGTLAPESWEGVRANFKNTFSYPGTLVWWKRARHLFNRQLQEFIDNELSDGPQGDRDLLGAG
jgi:hypothetical protein